jgi:ABC-type ATPase with predicted acetyltransferase domain
MDSKNMVWLVLLGVIAAAVVAYLLWLQPVRPMNVKEIEVKDADVAYLRPLVRTEIPTQTERLSKLFFTHVDTNKSTELSETDFSTTAEPIKLMFFSHADTHRTTKLASVAIPTANVSLEDLFISHVDSIGIMKLKEAHFSDGEP